MARLNEPPAAPAAATSATGESADAFIEKAPADFEEVRRRFIRQNRELAKNNSSQSLRIRTLELEVSRLLADNLELRNQTLRLQNEVCTAQRKAGGRVKAELRERIEALMGVVDGMEEDDGQDVPVPPTEKKPLEGNWRERQPLAELMRDSQMPTIQEDKQYPRRTLGADEIQTIRLSDHSSNESPDLGPPPVAHFDYDNAGDPVKNASPLGNKVFPLSTNTGEDEQELPAGLSVNLETRRKRKDGQPKIEIRRRSLMPPQSPEKEDEQPSAILRTGAKRKLADREAEKPIRPPSKGDFTFSRKVSGEDVQHLAVTEETQAKSEAQLKEQEKPARKVLGEKSVNMSPRKTTAAPLVEKPEKGKPVRPVASRFQSNARDNEKDKESAIPSRRRRTSSIPLPSPPRETPQILETVEIPPPTDSALPSTTGPNPKTPAALDLFSPTPSEPSARAEGGRTGTPPPGDLSTLSNTKDGGGTRPSRRTRGAPVNYAEPSLNAKMRRPSKQMVDAISGLQHHSRAMNSSFGRESGSRSIIKAEPVEEDEYGGKDWKDLPPAQFSPLGLKGGDVTAPTSFEPEPLAPSKEEAPPAPPFSSLLANSRKRRQSAQQASDDLETAMKKMEELEIYDFKESSSPLTDGKGTGENAMKTDKVSGKGAGKSHRRHSSVPKSAVGVDGTLEGAAREADGGEGRQLGMKGSARVASRRKSMML